MKKLALIATICIMLGLLIALAASRVYAAAAIESYEDAACTLVQNTFTAGMNQVWMKVTGLPAQDREYKTAFYDAAGNFIEYDINASVNKVLTGATVIFADYPSSMGDGD